MAGSGSGRARREREHVRGGETRSAARRPTAPWAPRQPASRGLQGASTSGPSRLALEAASSGVPVPGIAGQHPAEPSTGDRRAGRSPRCADQARAFIWAAAVQGGPEMARRAPRAQRRRRRAPARPGRPPGAGRAEVGALDLRDGVVVQLVLERPGGVQAEAQAGRGAAGAPGALLRGRLADRRDHQRLHAAARVVAVLLHEARVDDVLRARATSVASYRPRPASPVGGCCRVFRLAQHGLAPRASTGHAARRCGHARCARGCRARAAAARRRRSGRQGWGGAGSGGGLGGAPGCRRW